MVSNKHFQKVQGMHMLFQISTMVPLWDKAWFYSQPPGASINIIFHFYPIQLEHQTQSHNTQGCQNNSASYI